MLRQLPYRRASGSARVIDDEQVTRGMVLKALPHVPLGGSVACGQLRRGGRTAFWERPIQPEPFTKISGVKVVAPQAWERLRSSFLAP